MYVRGIHSRKDSAKLHLSDRCVSRCFILGSCASQDSSCFLKVDFLKGALQQVESRPTRTTDLAGPHSRVHPEQRARVGDLHMLIRNRPCFAKEMVEIQVTLPQACHLPT